MYELYKNELAEGRESFPAGTIVKENLIYIANWVVAGALLWPVQMGGWPVAAIGWASFVLIVQLLLKKHFCSGCCYYGKSCHLGWGRISSALCARDSGNPKAGMALAVPMYLLSPVLVLGAGVAIGLLVPVAPVHWVLTGVFVALNAVSFPLRKQGCSQCRMRKVCPGSAARSV